MSSLYILKMNPLPVCIICNFFSQSVGCLFVLFMISFTLQKLVSLVRSHLFILFLLLWEIDIRKHWHSLCQTMFFLGALWCFVFKCWSRSEFNFVYDMWVCPSLVDLHVVVHHSQYHLLKRFFSSLYSLASFPEDLIFHRCTGLFLGSLSIHPLYAWFCANTTQLIPIA